MSERASDKLFLTTRDLCQMTGMHRSTIYGLVSDGKFPSPSPDASTPGKRRWHRDVVARWLDKQRGVKR